MFNIINIKSISKFGVLNIGKGFKSGNKNKFNINNINLSKYFWNQILSKDFLEDFLLNKYLKNKNLNLSNLENIKLYKEIQFILDKINFIRDKINFVNKNDISKGEDIFFSFRFFSAILYYINDFFSEDELFLGLREGIVFNKKNSSLEELIDNIEYYKETHFIKLLIEPLINNFIKGNKKTIYKFEIFWPDELILVGVMGKIIKNINKNAKIAIDFSSGNEQFDFTQWVDLIYSSNKSFFEYYDYFIIDRDFGLGIKQIQEYLKGKIEKNKIQNIIFYEKKIYFNKLKKDNLTQDLFKEFIKLTFNGNNFSQILGEKSIYIRFLPYKCYWSNCNFCAINSQNKFSYNKKYSYNFFIDKWIDYIKKYNIRFLNFKDEAIPPKVIISFANKIIKNNLKVNYQFRTRFEKEYTYINCKILAKSGCGYCGMGLESAVERVNEEIGNKGNFGISIRDKIKIIHNFDKAGVSIHNYAIMGFPGETDKEAAITYKFLKDNIINSNYFTCSPNIFGLMKGPKIFTEMEKFGVEVKKEDLKNPFNLIYNFTYKGKNRNLGLLKSFEEDLHKTQFLPWLNKSTYISGRKFWDYIDRSYIFYLLKRFHKKNPFYEYMNCNNKILKQDFKILLNKNFKISDYYQLFEYSDDTQIYIYDWVGCKDIIIDKKYKNFIINYDNDIDLLENIQKNKLDVDNLFKKMIYLLLLNRILIKK